MRELPPETETLHRQDLLIQLSLARSQLLQQVIGLDTTTLSSQPVSGDWTAQDLLAHVAAWDELFAERLRLVAAGREAEIIGIQTEEMSARNIRIRNERQDWTLEQAVAACVISRQALLDALQQLPKNDLDRPLQVSWGNPSAGEWIHWRAEHDLAHAQDIADWRNHVDLAYLGGYKGSLLAQLAMERADLFDQMLHLPQDTLCKMEVLTDTTIRDLMAHAAAWDHWVLHTMMALRSGETLDLEAAQNPEAFNAAVRRAWRERPLGMVLAQMQEARATLQAWLSALPESAFLEARFVDEQDWSLPSLIQVQWQHDAEHAGHIAAWRERTRPPRKPGPKALLLAALQETRGALLAVTSLVPSGERIARPLTGEWSLKDVLGHIADWEWWVLDAVQQMAEGRAPRVESYESIQTWNEAHAAARQMQPWATVWQDFRSGRRALWAVLRGMSQAELETRYPAPWSDHDLPPYAWLQVILLDHDLEHAHDLMAVLSRG
jgi:uncharacterized damage-inducible protein DinB